jgi:acetyltransferase-like isoleucine patch superfamily enzyme
LVVNRGCTLVIGAGVGMSCTAINCQNSITIGDHVTIGGGTCIYDSDFHSLDPEVRKAGKEGIRSRPVVIEDNVFIGAHSTILKGVTIGKNSIVGACSVVTKTIPPGEIWAGNPAAFVKAIS